ncbi:MAG: hypothetical protein NTY68_00680 [Candidatus Micrarchaeota archaeon]|nr:hypothetical protein [Candidatus Micrarchaeota archaeon]
MTTAKQIHSKKGSKPKSDMKKTLRMAKDAIEAKKAPVIVPKPTLAKRAWTAVKNNYKKVGATAKKGTNKTLGFAWGASWRTAVTGVLVPFASYYLNTVAQSYHTAVVKGVHYSSTAKEAWAQMLNAVSPAVDKIADHPITSTLVAAAAWVTYKYTKPAAK